MTLDWVLSWPLPSLYINTVINTASWQPGNILEEIFEGGHCTSSFFFRTESCVIPQKWLTTALLMFYDSRRPWGVVCYRQPLATLRLLVGSSRSPNPTHLLYETQQTARGERELLHLMHFCFPLLDWCKCQDFGLVIARQKISFWLVMHEEFKIVCNHLNCCELTLL